MIKITNQNEFTTKYIIEVKFTIKGVVEKSDIVGAIFGQTGFLWVYSNSGRVIDSFLWGQSAGTSSLLSGSREQF